MKKRLVIVLSFLTALWMTACGGQTETSEGAAGQNGGTAEAAANAGTDWAIYWYLCGSDLESEEGLATDDLAEMMEAELPENVQVIIQTGGATAWQNDIVSADKAQRYLYDGRNMELIWESDAVNMGDPQTLTDFLTYAREKYPAKHTMVTFWNHGGGSVMGVAFDQQFDMDSLTLDEMGQSFSAAFEKNPEDPPVDIIGFDACLMASVDTADTFADFGQYLVASEEVEPGSGWLYSGWLGALAANPEMEPLALSQSICDTYVEGCTQMGTADDITLSVTNLSKARELVAAYDDFGKDALANALDNTAFYASFSQAANTAENYGGNTREQGYTNMTDLGDLVKGSLEYLPKTGQNVLSQLNNCVEYKVYGKYCSRSNGLSCYYSYDNDIDELNAYEQLGAGEAFKYFYEFSLTGNLSEAGMEYISRMNYDTLPQLMTLEKVNWEDIPLTVDEEGCATLTLGAEANEILSTLRAEFCYYDEENDQIICLGSDNDIVSDWDNGVFKDNFQGVWLGIDGALCYMEIAEETEDYNEYTVPILLNDELYNLSVIYDFHTGEYRLEGARKPIDESGAADRNVRRLQVGDKVQTIHYVMPTGGDSEEFTSIPAETITVTADTAAAETELENGFYIMIYEMRDSHGNTAYSSSAIFDMSDDGIVTTVE